MGALPKATITSLFSAHAEKATNVLELVQAVEPSKRLAEIVELDSHKIGLRRVQRVAAIARACGSDAPDLKAKVAKPAKQVEKRVPGLPGVVEIAYRNGKRVWYLRFTDPLTGKRNIVELGEIGVVSFMDMAALAKRYRDEIAAGRSPKSGAMTLATFVSIHFCPWVIQQQRSHRDTLARLRYLLALFGEKSIGDIDHRDGEVLIQYLQNGCPEMRFGKLNNATINRVVMAARTVFRCAIELGFITRNPFKAVAKLRESPPAPKALETDELARLLAALNGQPLIFGLLVKLLIATAARINEILSLKECDVDLATGVIHLRMTKAGVAQTLPITSTVLGILESLKDLRRSGNPHLFPAKTGTGPMVPPYQRLRKVLAAAGLDHAGFHLFRRTVATQLLRLPDVDTLTAARLLRHKSVRTLEVHYLATSQKRLRQAANDIGERLLAVPGGF